MPHEANETLVSRQTTGLSQWFSGPRLRRALDQVAELSAKLEKAYEREAQFAKTSEVTQTQLEKMRDDLRDLRSKLDATEVAERRASERVEELQSRLQKKLVTEAEIAALRARATQMDKKTEYFREAQKSSEARAKKLERELREAKSAASKYHKTKMYLEAAQSAVSQLQRRNKQLQLKNSDLAGVVSQLGRLEEEVKMTKALTREAQDSEARLTAILGEYRSKLAECDGERQRLRSELESQNSGSLLHELYDLVPFSCWRGAEQEVATNVLGALKASGRFQSIAFHSFDRAGRNCYFVCRVKLSGNHVPQVLLIGFNLRKRKIWASVHEPGHSL